MNCLYLQHLGRSDITEQTDKYRVRVRNKDYELKDIKKDYQN